MRGGRWERASRASRHLGLLVWGGGCPPPGSVCLFRAQGGFLQTRSPPVRQGAGPHCIWLCEEAWAASLVSMEALVSQREEGGLCSQWSGSRRCDRTLRTRWNFSRRVAHGAPAPRLPQSSLLKKPVVRASLSSGWGRNPGGGARRGWGRGPGNCLAPPTPALFPRDFDPGGTQPEITWTTG